MSIAIVRKRIRQFSRKVHLWLALAVLIPAVIVIVSGLLLQVKKEVDWVQPPTMKGASTTPTLSFERIVTIASSIAPLNVASWEDIDRLDVRPDKGVIKVRANNHWEAQIDATTGEVLHVAYRRSDTIEAIHDGSWFADFAKLWIFLPAAILLFIMWASGTILLYTTLKSKQAKARHRNHSDTIDHD